MPAPTDSGAPQQQGRRARRTRHAAAAVAVTATAVVLAGLTPGVASAKPAPPHTTGLQRSYKGVSAITGMGNLAAAAAAQGGAIRAATTLPPSVDLTGFAVPAGDQDIHGACVSWTTGYTIAGWESNYTHHAGAPFAPMSVYNQVNGGDDEAGTTFPDNWSVLERNGDVEAAAWSHPLSDYTSQPDAAEKADAAQHKLSAHTTLFNAGQELGYGPEAQTLIETALANNQPVGIALPVWDDFFYLDQSDSTWTKAQADADDAAFLFEGWHAVTILGYDSTGVTIENSWGPGWGDNGFATLDWDFVESYVPEAYAAGSFTANGLTPSVSQVSSDVVSTAGGASLDVTVSRLASVDTSSASAVQFVSVADPTVTADAPVTASTDTTLTVTAPALPDPGEYRVVVTGYNGASAPNGTDDVVSAVDPGSVALLPGQYGRSNTDVWVNLGGLGFGATSGDFTANNITATVDGASAPVLYVDDNHLQVQVPAAAVGSTASVVVSFNGSPAPAVSVTYAPPVPVISSVQPAHVADAGGTAVTVTVADGTSLGATPTVVLQGIADPTLTVPATVTGVNGSTLTFTAPALAGGNPRDYDLVVTGDGGTSTVIRADRFGYRTPFGGHATVSAISALGGTVTISGSGYGANATTYGQNRVTATVGGHAATVRWINDRTLTVAYPAGTPGRNNGIVLLHDGVPGPTIAGPRYAALITANVVRVGHTSGWTTSIRGAGLSGASVWVLVDGRARRVATLAVIGSRQAQLRTRGGSVWISSSSSAIIQLPPMPRGDYRIGFVPNQRVYPGASYAFSALSAVYYR